MLLILLVSCAPLPFPKATLPVVGDYALTYRGSDWDVTLRADGSYTATLANGLGSRWEGEWTADGNLISVSEYLAASGPSASRVKWAAKILTPATDGKGVDLPSIWMLRNRYRRAP